MSRQKRPGPRNWLRCGWLAIGLLGGCTHNHLIMNGGYGPCRNKDDVIPPEPLGTFNHQWQDEQAAKAEASDFTIFLNEWYMGGLELGPYGQQHLTHIAGRLPTCVYPVVIEPTMDRVLNQKRRDVIVAALLNQGITDAEARVIIAYPQAESMSAEEGEINYYQMLQTTRLRNGFGYGGFGGFGGGFGAGLGGFGGGWTGRGIYRGGYGPHLAGFGGGWGGGPGGFGGGWGGRGGYFGY